MKRTNLWVTRWNQATKPKLKIYFYAEQIELDECTWMFFEVSLHLRTCHVPQLQIILSSKRRCENCDIASEIINSTIGLIYAYQRNYVYMEGINIPRMKSSLKNGSLFTFVNSNLTLNKSNLTLSKLQGDESLIHAKDQSCIVISKSVIQNNTGKTGLIFIQDNSSLEIINSIFKSNSISLKTLAPITIIHSRLTIKDDSFFTANKGLKGGVIHASDASKIFIEKSKFSRNEAQFAGGVLYGINVRIHISNTVFMHNKAIGYKTYGGALYVRSEAIASVKYCIWSGNQAGIGGVIFAIHSVHFTIDNNTFDQNFAKRDGGVISVTKYSQFVIGNNTYFMSNSVAKGHGGVMWVYNTSSVSVTNVTFKNNTAASEGGVLKADDNSHLKFDDVLFLNNTALSNGGAITVVNTGIVEISHSRFINNSAYYLGGALIFGGNISFLVYEVHFKGNQATFVGGMAVEDGSNGTLVTSSFSNHRSDSNSVILISKSWIIITDSHINNNVGGPLIQVGARSSLTLSKCQISESNRIGDQSLIQVVESKVRVEQMTFYNNTSGADGTVLMIRGKSEVSTQRCLFTGNMGRQGGVFNINSGGKLSIHECTFLHNSATDGGVVYAFDSTIKVSECEFVGNMAHAGGGFARAGNTSISLVQNNFTGHYGFYGGVLLLSDNSTLEGHKIIFRNNTSRQGGAIFKHGSGVLSLDQSHLIDNSALYGGSIYYISAENLKISKSTCIFNPEGDKQVTCITFDLMRFPAKPVIFETHNMTISNRIRNQTIHSKDGLFLTHSRHNVMISNNPNLHNLIYWRESVYASSKVLYVHYKCISATGGTSLIINRGLLISGWVDSRPVE